MTKKIAVIIGHPLKGSLNHALAEQYVNEARMGDTEVEIIDLAEKKFPLSPDSNRQELRARDEAELAKQHQVIQEMIQTLKSADHLVFFFPSWWGTYPAVFKGFIDRVILSGVAFQYGDGPTNWKRLFAGKTARIFTTFDTPKWFNLFKYRDPSGNSLKHAVLWYVGVKTIGLTRFDQVRFSDLKKREKWMRVVARLANQDLR